MYQVPDTWTKFYAGTRDLWCKILYDTTRRLGHSAHLPYHIPTGWYPLNFWAVITPRMVQDFSIPMLQLFEPRTIPLWQIGIRCRRHGTLLLCSKSSPSSILDAYLSKSFHRGVCRFSLEIDTTKSWFGVVVVVVVVPSCATDFLLDWGLGFPSLPVVNVK